MSYILSPPNSWDRFEDLCYRLWQSIWGPTTQKHGRRGQPQNGVDVFGIPYSRNRYTGVQCKGKNGNYRAKLKKDEISKECEKARLFTPQLEHLIFATTSPRDAKIQQYCREISDNKSYPFSVECWGWDDIQEEILYRSDIRDYFYKDFPIVHTNSLTLDFYFSLGKIEAFFAREHIKCLLTEEQRNHLALFAYELFDNAFKYGHANTCTLKVEKQQLLFIENGKAFNILNLTEGNGGYDTITNLRKKVINDISYNRENEQNIYVISLPANICNEKAYEITFSAEQIRGRQSFSAAAKQVSIPIGTEELIINTIGAIPPSGAYAYFESLQNECPRNIHIKAYLHHSAYYVEHLKEICKGLDIEFIIR
jgi:hypothetical protein